MTDAEKRITFDPAVNGGKPSIKGIPIVDVLNGMQDSFSRNGVVPDGLLFQRTMLTFADLAAVMEYAAFISSVNVRVGVSVWVWNDEGKLLLGERAGSHGAGMLAAPGGHQDYGETYITTAFREVEEECGPQFKMNAVKVPPPVDIRDFMNVGKHYLDVAVICQHRGGEPVVMEPKKCKGWGWYSIAELREAQAQGRLFPTMWDRVVSGDGRLPA